MEDLKQQIMEKVKQRKAIDETPDCRFDRKTGSYVYNGHRLPVYTCCFERYKDKPVFVINACDSTDMLHRLIFYLDTEYTCDLSRPNVVLVTGELS